MLNTNAIPYRVYFNAYTSGNYVYSGKSFETILDATDYITSFVNSPGNYDNSLDHIFTAFYILDTINNVFINISVSLLPFPIGGLPFKKAVFNLTQTATDPPIITETIYNNLGIISPSYIAEGDYFLSSTGLFTLNKTSVILTILGSPTNCSLFSVSHNDINTIEIFSNRYLIIFEDQIANMIPANYQLNVTCEITVYS